MTYSFSSPLLAFNQNRRIGRLEVSEQESGLCIFYFAFFLMGEGFILLTMGCGFMAGMYHPPFDKLKICTTTYDMKLKLYR